jgi:hypothetical protein
MVFAGSLGRVRKYDRAMSRWKPSRPLLVALIVLHIIVTTITLRDLSQRTDSQVRGPLLFWRVFIPLQMGNSALYWLVGRRRETESTRLPGGSQSLPCG